MGISKKTDMVREKQVARQLGPGLSFVSVALFVSFLCKLAAPDMKYVFGSATNGCYLAAGIYLELVNLSTVNRRWSLWGMANGGSLLLSFLGAGSLAYHVVMDVGSAGHIFDVFFAYTIATHVAYVAINVILKWVVTFFVKGEHLRIALILSNFATSLLFTVAIIVLCVNWETVHNNSSGLFVVISGFCVIALSLMRVIVIRYDGTRFRRVDVWMAVVDLNFMLALALTAIFSQSTLLGQRYHSSMKEYDLYHGEWHALNAMLMLTFYIRAEESSAFTEGMYDIVTRPPEVFDVLNIAFATFNAALSVILKESRVDPTVALGLLAATSLVMFLVAGGTLTLTMNDILLGKRIWDRRRRAKIGTGDGIPAYSEGESEQRLVNDAVERGAESLPIVAENARIDAIRWDLRTSVGGTQVPCGR